jgi:DNA-binding response OmpR family regulator
MEEARRLMPDLILLGYLEPRGTSFQLYKELRDGLLTKSIPLVVIDVRREEHSRKGWRRDEGMQMDADDYLVQPVDPIVLRETVERILNKVRKQPRDLVEVLGEMERIVKRVNKIEESLLR